MDAVTFNKQLDSQLEVGGEVSQDLFFMFSEAHSYDAASTVGWLWGKLQVLRSRLSRGETLSLYDPESKSQRTVATLPKFEEWISINFPSVVI